MFWLNVTLVALAANAILQGLDAWTTVVSLQAGAGEQNPFSRFLMEQAGIGAWVAVKAVLVAAIVWVAVYAVRIRDDKEALKRVAYPAIALAVWMAFVLHNNLTVMGVI